MHMYFILKPDIAVKFLPSWTEVNFVDIKL